MSLMVDNGTETPSIMNVICGSWHGFNPIGRFVDAEYANVLGSQWINYSSLAVMMPTLGLVLALVVWFLRMVGRLTDTIV